MKLIRFLLFFIIIIVVIGLLYISIQPGNYEVSRTKIVNYTTPSVFNTVNDLKTWEKWGPWHDEDTTIVVTYGDKTVGVGASDSWTSEKDGPGKMKTIAVEENKAIVQEMQFGDNDPSAVIWGFESLGEKTKITWTMKDDKAPFIFKAFSAMSGGWDNMLGPMLEKGLNNLEVVIKNQPKPYRFSAAKIVKTEDKIFIGYPHQMKIDHEAMTAAFEKAMPKAGMYAIKSGLTYGDFVPAAVYTKWDEKTGETAFYIGLLLHKDLKPGEGMEVVKLTATNNVMLSKFGNYGVGDYEAHIEIDTYIKANKLKQRFPMYELYVNDPADVKLEDIQTDIYYPLE